MWLFELNGSMKRGLKIDLDPDPRVVIGHDTHKKVVLPLGSTLSRLVVGDQYDQSGVLRLERADLQEHLGGLVLVHQSEAEAAQDGRALVAVDFPWHDPQEGERVEYRRITFGRGKNWKQHRTMPQILEDRLLVFNPEDGVEIRYVSRVVPQKMRVKWDGRVLGCWRAQPEERLRA